MSDIKKLLESLDSISETKPKDNLPAPRNVVAKNAKTAGAGQHKNPREIENTRREKHKKDFLKDIHEAEKDTRVLRKIEEAYATFKKQSVTEEQDLSIQQLATVSDEALDNAYGYGRSTPGNSFGWQANLMSAAYAKKMIDAGATDIDQIADAIHKGWNVTAQKFVQNPDQFDDTEKLRAADKLDAKLAQREKLMKINYAQLDDQEQEKDRVVARALLQAIKGQQSVTENTTPDDEKVIELFAQIVADDTGYSVKKVNYEIYDEGLRTPSGIPVYFYSFDGDVRYIGALPGGKPTAIVNQDGEVGSRGSYLELSIGGQVEYVIKGKTLFSADDQQKIANAKPGDNEYSLVMIALDLMWGRMQHKFMEQGVAEGSENLVAVIDGVRSDRTYNDKDHAHNSLSKLVSYGKAKVAELYIDGEKVEHFEIGKKYLDFEPKQLGSMSEAGPFSYGAKKPRKGSVADLAAQKRKEQEKGKQPIEPKDQRVGVAQVVKDVAEGSDNITAIFSGYGNYMSGRGSNVFKHYGITVLDKQYFEDEDIAEYTVSGSKEALDQARAYLERSDQFGGMIIKQGVAESDISGLLAASKLNKSFIITANLAEGGTKKFRVKAQSENTAVEKFKKHYTMAQIVNVKEEDVKEATTSMPTSPTSPTSATSATTTSATQQKPLNLQAAQQQLKIPGNPIPGGTSTGGAGTNTQDMAVQAVIQKAIAGKPLDSAENSLYHSILQKASK